MIKMKWYVGVIAVLSGTVAVIAFLDGNIILGILNLGALSIMLAANKEG